MVKVREDMTGWKMWEHGVPDSRLTVIKQVEDYISPKGYTKSQWLCECNCEEHNQVIVEGTNLKNGNTLSCGCLRHEQLIERLKKDNEWLDGTFTDEYGEYMIGLTSNTNKKFFIDAEDYNQVKDYCWYEYKTKNMSRLATHIEGCCVLMHTFLGFKGYDHEDRNELNNRKYNLRLCTQQENTINKSKQSNNKSGITGVCWDKSRDKWLVQIQYNNKHMFLGHFDNKDDAIRARLNAEVKYFGEFAPQKHLYEQYGIKTPQNDCEKLDKY